MEDESPLLIAPSSSWLARNDAKLRTRRWKVIVSSSYCLAMAALGCVYAAQGPATIALAEQCGIVQPPPKNSTGGKINARDLPEIGIANALDAGAGGDGHLLAWDVVLIDEDGGLREGGDGGWFEGVQ